MSDVPEKPSRQAPSRPSHVKTSANSQRSDSQPAGWSPSEMCSLKHEQNFLGQTDPTDSDGSDGSLHELQTKMSKMRTTQRHWFLEIYWAVAANECKRDSKSPYWYCSRTCLRYDLEKTQAPVKRSLNADVCSWSKANTWWTWATEASLGSWKTGFYRLGGGLSGLEKQTCHRWWEPCGF